MTLQNVRGDGDVNVVQSRIERGAAAMGTDGRIGTVEQIVVERESGQLLSLVIRDDTSDTEFELPASHVRRATGDHVYLDISHADLASHPEMTTPYHPEQYLPVYHGDIVSARIAGRAAGRERPVITDVEENAAAIVTPELAPETEPPSPPPTDERASAPPPPPPAAGSSVGAPMAPLPGRGEVLERLPTDWGEAVGPEERPVPTPEVSATPSATGPLMGGKPSTGGMGIASSVPCSPAPALDTLPVSPHLPPYTTEHPEESQPPAPPPASDHTDTTEREPPHATAIRSVPVTTPVVTPSPQLSAPEPGAPGAFAPGTVPSPQQGTPAPEPRQCAGSRAYLPDLLRNMAKSPEPWIIAAGFGAGTLGGLLLRQRRPSPGGASATEWVRRGMEGALGQTQDRLSEAPERSAGRAGESHELARRMALRGRWFRRGLLLGGASALLFTPKAGTETRARLRDLLEQWWSSPSPD